LGELISILIPVMDEQFLTINIKSAVSALAISYASTKKLNLMEQTGL
jgi:hypothetical protein